MKRIFKYLLGVFAVFFASYSCTETNYTLGDLTAPSNIVITKAFGRAIRMAITADTRMAGIMPSTKGSL